MDLQRKDYPALLDALPPAQAVNVLNDRMKHVSNLNSQIADWLQERRRVEELYVQGLRKLANKHPPDEASDLGIFSTPWQKIVSSTSAVAESHHLLAQRIEADVERPLREFAGSNREVQAMSTISGNLAAMAREIDTAQKKSAKLQDKGGKASASKVAGAVADVENASMQWESQAPYVFEKLQAVDESRLNHLRDALTQFQTHEVDQVERNRATAEETLNVLLNIETADEIKTFVLRMQSGEKPQPTRKPSSIGTPSRTLAPPPSTPSIQQPDDNRSQKSGSAPEEKHNRLQGLKRFGTVLGRRRQSVHPYGRASSPEGKKSSSNLGSAFSGFGKGKSKERDAPSSSSDRPVSPARRLSLTPRASDASSSPKQIRRSSTDRPNGTSPEPTNELPSSSNAINGTMQESIPELNEPLSPPPASEPVPEPEKDSEGFSVPPSTIDAITEAQREASMTAPEIVSTPQFKLDIRNAPIKEEEADADAALANMANTLRAQQAAPTKRSNTLRGRRDVRNTIFVPNPATPELASIGEAAPPLPSAGSASATFPTPAPPPQPTSPQFKAAHRTLLSDHDHAASDTQSVRSGRSLSSSASTTIKHPELHEPGLNSSLVETVSAWFEQGNVTKAMVIGQVALAYNPVDLSAPFGTDTIRLENFPVLEKVAPNPAFIEQSSDNPGNYTVDLAKITKTSVAFHYQVHLDSTNLSSFAPILLHPGWKSEPTQTSVILHYSLNPTFGSATATSITIHNLVLVLRLEPGVRTTSCQSKPAGTFSREKGLIYWRLGDVTFSREQPAQIVRARFLTDGEAKPGNAEARWEITGEQSLSLGSGLSVSQSSPSEVKTEGESDPFADADETAPPASPAVGWKSVASVKRITSGTYLGV
ncbi:Muniscin C-terminal mu homology domain-containing protein [Lophiotrema nucula]|uniref:Muniscin C-terminal mu homology domain-containing protein n=1 Tax=Lophiotrema nucula TaxID=690887 RepID=A0A6A5Z9Z6_9PLEO|nr:Muniscin C-terminal mu homology domain-containing protein [Lophiotrema nucula]